MSKKVKYYYDTENLAYRKINTKKRKKFEKMIKQKKKNIQLMIKIYLKGIKDYQRFEKINGEVPEQKIK